ncbi:MAG TPA: MFS transporter [Streptomyces sp.]|nr:MFS transporter [Streptomyces sp.]
MPRSALRRVPLRGSYPAAVAMALLALCPFLVLTTASSLLRPQLMHDLGAGMFALQLTSGLANAGYAFGAVAAADVFQRISRRSLYVACEVGFLLSSVLAAAAQGIVAFAAGMILQGVATGMLLVAALPPLVTNHGADRLPTTAAFVDLGLFGVVTLGPLAGGLAESFQSWRLLYAGVAALGAAGVLTGLPGGAARVPSAGRRHARTSAALSGLSAARCAFAPPPCRRTHLTPSRPPCGRTTLLGRRPLLRAQRAAHARHGFRLAGDPAHL